MKEVRSITHEHVVKLLHNKFVVVVGDSIQRGVYKDLVTLLQTDKYLTDSQLRSKGELSFEQDALVEGGSLGALHNGVEYQEVRQYKSEHHLLRFYFITRVFSSYMRSILSDFIRGPKPDILIINSCVWDISRYNSEWTRDYKEDLQQLFEELKALLPMETLVIWNMTMPLAEKIRGGFLVAEIEDRMPHLRSDVIEANFYSGILADAYGLDVLDLHYNFRFHLQHRVKDGVHWNAIAHRMISGFLLRHVAHAWGVTVPLPPPAEKTEPPPPQTRSRITGAPLLQTPQWHWPPPNYYNSAPLQTPYFLNPPLYSQSTVFSLRPVQTLQPRASDFYSDSLALSYFSFEEPKPEHQHLLHTRSRRCRGAGGAQTGASAHRGAGGAHTGGGSGGGGRDQECQNSLRSRHQFHYAPYSYSRPRHNGDQA